MKKSNAGHIDRWATQKRGTSLAIRPGRRQKNDEKQCLGQENEGHEAVSKKDCPVFYEHLPFGAPRAKHLRNHVKVWFQYLTGHMRNSTTSRFGYIVLLLLLGVLPGHRLFAAEEVATSSETVSEDTSTKQEETGTKQSVGIGKFAALPFHVSVSVRGGYDDNVLTSSTLRVGSAFATVNLALSYAFGTPRTTISLQTNGGITRYFERPGGVTYDFNPNLNFSLVHKATPRLTLSLTSYSTYQSQPDFAFNAGLNRRSGSFFYTADKFSAAFRWTPRFSTVTSYTIAAIQYKDPAVGDFEDRFEHTFGNEFRFLVWPTTSLVGEYRFGLIAYNSGVRNSTTHFLLAGFDHSFSPRFNISTRAGVESRSYTDLNDNRTDPYFEGTLTYALGPHMSLSWVNRYSIEEPDVGGSQSRTTFRSGLSGSYNITQRIIAALTGSFQHDENAGTLTPFFFSPPFAEDAFSVSLSLRYAMNRNWGVELGHDFTEVISDIQFREYYRNRIYGGVNFTF